MESVYQEKSKFRMSKRKALVITLSLLAVALIVSEPVYASTPWWVSGIGAVAGGIVGSLTGSPIGTIAGAAAGAALADYIYSITHKTAQMPYYYPNEQKIENQYAQSYENLTSQEMIDSANQAKTTVALFTEDYYYNAQQQEAIVPYFLGNSSLNLFNISLASGTYATINNVSNSVYSPIDTVLYQTWYTGSISCNNGFTTNQTGQTYTYSGGYSGSSHFDLTGYTVYGSALENGNYTFISPQNQSTSIFRYQTGLAYLNITNFYTGKTYNITSYGIQPLNTSKIPYGFYLINHNSGNLLTTGIQVLPNGNLDTSLSLGRTQAFTGPVAYLVPTPNLILVNESAFSADEVEFISSGTYCVKSSTYVGNNNVNPDTPGSYQPAIQFTGISNYYTSFQSNLNNIYSAANSYFTTLKTLGFTNINQIPAKDIIPFPSNVVPSSMLNGTFSAQELEELYIAYLNDLNNTFHNSTLFNGKNFTKYVNQTMFVNGFLTVYGNLTYTSGTTTYYVNDTDFFIQTYTNKLTFVKGKTTNLTGEIYPVLILNGSQNGTLLYVDASIYVIGLTLAGKNISNYTLEPEQITYVLPQTVNVGAPNTNGFLTSASNFLDKYYLYVAVIIVSALVIFVYSESRKNAGKGKE